MSSDSKYCCKQQQKMRFSSTLGTAFISYGQKLELQCCSKKKSAQSHDVTFFYPLRKLSMLISLICTMCNSPVIAFQDDLVLSSSQCSGFAKDL